MGDPPLVRICDLAGRPRGTGFVADERGTVLTSHEVVDGLEGLVVHAPDGTSDRVGPGSVVELPGVDLALVRTRGLGVPPLPVAGGPAGRTGAYLRIAACGWREARVLDRADVTYTAAGRSHLVRDAIELAVGTAGADALRLGGGAAGGPVLDARTGAVVAVLATALRAGRQAAGFAVPLRAAAAAEPRLAALLARNDAAVPVYGSGLNLAGVLHLTAVSVGSDGPGPAPVAPVERPDLQGELTAFEAGGASVLALVGAPGSGRTTELAALAARRAGREGAAPTLWLRGADLRADDTSVADAVRRALARAGRIVAASRSVEPGALGDLSPESVAGIARAAGRPLVLLLDGPEEMPPVLAHRLAGWTRETERWLTAAGVRLVLACRPEYWEQAGPLFTGEALHGRAGRLPACVRVGELTAAQARRARQRYGIPEGVLAPADAGHPLVLRLLGEVRAALPDRTLGRPDREEVFAAHLDLLCLRVAVRLAAADGVRGRGVRRLAARVSGRLHEAARRSLGPGQGELDRETFEELFPWGARGRAGGWASAVLAEGALVPAGSGYRFAHEEVADWIQGMHLDLDGALDALVLRRRSGGSVPVPRHRAGPVVRALLLVERQGGTDQLGARLRELAQWCGPHGTAEEAGWWAGHLASEVLLRVRDARPYRLVLEGLADRGAFGPWFWTALPVDEDLRFELLRRLVVHDAREPGGRYLDAVAACLAADPTRAQRRLIRWFDDERPLPALPDATVATAAQALLHTHRHRAVDDLLDALADRAHPRAGELLTALTDEEPSALCRAVARWAEDERPARHTAAATHGPRVAARVTADADREPLRRAARALLDRPLDQALHSAALAVLVQDPRSRPGYLERALRRFAEGDPRLPASALAPALTTHPEQVFEAFRTRLTAPGPGTAELPLTLADLTTPALARRAATLMAELARVAPHTAAGHVAAFVDRRLEHGSAARGALFPLVAELLRTGPTPVRAALAPVLAAPGTATSRGTRAELLDVLLGRERDLDVLAAVVRAAARGAVRLGQPRTRELVHRTGTLLVRTPEGAARFDRTLVELARSVPGFAAPLAHWLAAAPREWAALVGPSARRAVESVAGVRVPA
ncbi:trypsin-like peptidase domain-containing protein [Streptomyces sp. NPDC102406]|uniref:trypsin-like peptidase domain-containing protein n=1 Tax=Streptomyces sp. NPDC102406 TaxID=3366171 RepID=UPI0038261BAB